MSVDHLEDMQTDIDAALENWEAGHDATAAMYLQAAQAKALVEIAHALIELNETVGDVRTAGYPA